MIEEVWNPYLLNNPLQTLAENKNSPKIANFSNICPNFRQKKIEIQKSGSAMTSAISQLVYMPNFRAIGQSVCGLDWVDLYAKPKYIFILIKILGGGHLNHYDSYLWGILGMNKNHISSLISLWKTPRERIPWNRSIVGTFIKGIWENRPKFRFLLFWAF